MITTASAAIVREKKILLVKRLQTALLFPGCWAFPGGKSEPGETPEEIAIREVKEETNLDFSPTKHLLTGHYGNRVMHRFTGSFSGEVVIQQEELSDYGWFTFKETQQLEMAFDYRNVLEYIYRIGLIK
jgi:8-oxo-dGTP pyrophosphatase MutT (NUDIX family)